MMADWIPWIADRVQAGLIYLSWLLFVFVWTGVFLLILELLRSNRREEKIRVLIVSPCPGAYGGMEAFVFAVARYLARLPEFEVRILFKMTANFKMQPALAAMCEEAPVPVVFAQRASATLFLWLWWADVVHGQNTSPDVIFLTRLLGRKLVLTIHNWHRRKFGLYSIVWRTAMRLAHARWYNSHFVWETWEPEKKMKGSRCVPTVSVLPTGTLPPSLRRGFVFAGRWIANKGIEELIRAYATARLNRDEWPLRIMGAGPLRAEMEALIQQTGVTGVELCGFVSDDVKAEMIRSSRWMVVPPNTREDLGLTPIEARSVGVPSIITNDGGLKEAAGSQALVCTPGNWRELAELLEQAAAMSEEEYAKRSQIAQKELADYLQPLSFYSDAIARLVGRNVGPVADDEVLRPEGKRPLRILLHSYVFSPSVGGIESVSDVLARHWQEAGHRVTLLTETPGPLKMGHPFPVIRHPRLGTKIRLILDHDLVHSNGSSLRSCLMAWLIGMPFSWTHTAYQLVSVDGLGVFNGKKTPLSPWGSILYYFVRGHWMRAIGGGMKLFLRRWVAKVVLANVDITHYMAKKYPVPRQMVIYNPINTPAFAVFDKETAFEEIARAEATFTYLGRVVSEKGIDTLLHALASVHREEVAAMGCAHSTLKIIGDGQWKKHLQNLAKKLGLSDYVIWKDFCIDAALVREVKRSGIVVIPSLTEEPMGVVGLEMMAAGKPLIVSGPSGLSECVGEAGLCFRQGNVPELAAAMRRLSSDRALQQHLIKKGLERSSLFDSQISAQQYLDLFSKIRAVSAVLPT